MGEIGFVADRHGGHDAFAVDDQLAQALQAVEDALRRSAAHLDARRSHGERIGLGLQRAVHRQTDVALGGGFHHPPTTGATSPAKIRAERRSSAFLSTPITVDAVTVNVPAPGVTERGLGTMLTSGPAPKAAHDRPTAHSEKRVSSY